jgi:hypothetical protein
VVHGDDPCLLPDGTDAYAYAKQQKRFKMIKRTEGVSSTDIVGRMLMCTRDNARFREVSPPAQGLYKNPEYLIMHVAAPSHYNMHHPPQSWSYPSPWLLVVSTCNDRGALPRHFITTLT